jgi:hypothetical protein
MDDIYQIVQTVIGRISAGLPREQQILQIWDRLLNNEEKRHSSIIKIQKGQLEVGVDSSVWLYQLKLKKKTLLEQLQKEIPDIENIYFKLGKGK